MEAAVLASDGNLTLARTAQDTSAAKYRPWRGRAQAVRAGGRTVNGAKWRAD